MKTGKYTIKDFFVNRYLKQVIVPEIQRDYVWQEEQLMGLLNSLLADFFKFSTYETINFDSALRPEDRELAESFNSYRKRLTCASNIGFIYAYNDEEFAGRYFLIDGQQRITSAFLILLTLAHRNPGLTERFRSTYFEEGTLKFDYKVRDASHDFLFKLVPYLLDTPEEKVDEQMWMYSNPDATVQNLFNNFRSLQRFFSSPSFQQSLLKRNVTEEALYGYLEEYTEFYYFDTNISEQGEDLYIYMNARGEQVQSNENVKADLLSRLSTLEEKNEYGKKWESWQDFFWQHRGTNKNADAGFNEFLACIAGLTNLASGNTSGFYSPDEYKANGGIKTSQILSALDLATIEKYVECLMFLQENKDTFKSRYTNCGWVDTCLDTMWNIFNSSKEKTNWYADYNNDNRGTERNRMAFIWPVLRFIVRRSEVVLPINEAFRVLRIHYLHFTNYDRSVAQIEKEVEDLCNLGPFVAFGNAEENLKHALYTSVDPSLVKQYEELIWEIEDHKFNLNGRDVGGINISHLVDLNPVPSLADLQKVRNRFYELFPLDKQRYKTLQNALLYYGPYQHRENPGYYFNYNFGDWRRTIRGKGSEESNRPEKAFKGFFADFLRFEGTLNDFLRTMRATVLRKEDAQEHYQKVLWYSQYLENRTWSKGDYIAFSNDWDGQDMHFPDCRIIYNTRGDFRGYFNCKLQDLLPVDTTEQVTALELPALLDSNTLD
ncbi:DUF262 domain-containing protein [Hymenobacter sp. BT186]|uniref:DUF262 domain-containing protein n=1 Tax=Hymenobacter telluris TaxID=2816474 RepID=A0A939F179_9BACT|nr:DUF262 domain-containing protein [Hymenobacter telluris]MBO0360871.1 DUF262 domain-containing protein [Hymenobacter telluris]MBW3376900.1 DUF262 domain-containing protein [Hymenobacter norwichensis]